MHTNELGLATPSVRETHGIVLSAEGVSSIGKLQIVRLAEDGATFDAFAVSSEALDAALEQPLLARFLQIAQSDTGANTMPLLVSMPADPFVDGFTHLPESLCPVQGVVLGIKQLVADIQAPPLRLFLMRVFERRDVFSSFWAMPASARHHHSKPGGLAVHTLEVADDLASHGQLSELERDLGVAGALLHDIGKVWSYNQDMSPNSANLAMGHELVGLCKLEPELATLEMLWPDGAYAMRCLLSGHSRMRSDGSIPSSLLPRIKACDQRSCEREMRQIKRVAVKPWAPRPWSDNLAADDRFIF